MKGCDKLKVETYNEDCLIGMTKIPDHSVDMILCDLPYGTTSCAWDTVIDSDLLWSEYKRIIKSNGNIVLFATFPFGCTLISSSDGWFKYDLVWEKNVPTGMSYANYRPMRYHENILIFCEKSGTFNKIMKERVGEKKECYKGYDHYCGKNNHNTMDKVKKQYDPDYVNPSTVLDFKVVPNRNGKLHPTQKPVDLCEWLIRTYSNEGDIVLDNCMGSGSTAIAAINTNRNFIGFELDASYYNIAKNRVNQHIIGLKMQDTYTIIA
jgi:site-specific DNA-methyltransferase (adenine-specific)